MIVFGAATDIGLTRSENQDAYGVFPETVTEGKSPDGQLFVVADGMGGHRGGKHASTLAVQTIGRKFFDNESAGVRENLMDALQAANDAVYSAASSNHALSGMGTTCVALAANGTSIHIAHIGDSRVYGIKDGTILQLTDDHSTVAEMQRRGILTAEEAEHHPERSILYKALGTKFDAEIDLQPDIIVTGIETFVLCSDGLTNMVSDAEILKIVTSQSPQEACDALVFLANERGGFDNITVIVVQVSV